jgi:hypothetical protein
VIAVHHEHAADLAALIVEATDTGVASTEHAAIDVHDPSVLEVDPWRDEIFDPVEPGLIAGRGFSVRTGGDGDYRVRTASRAGRIVCIIAGELTDEARAALDDDDLD